MRMTKTTSVMALIVMTALVSSGCSNTSVVFGNLASTLVAFGLFFTTINLTGKS